MYNEGLLFYFVSLIRIVSIDIHHVMARRNIGRRHRAPNSNVREDQKSDCERDQRVKVATSFTDWGEPAIWCNKTIDRAVRGAEFFYPPARDSGWQEGWFRPWSCRCFLVIHLLQYEAFFAIVDRLSCFNNSFFLVHVFRRGKREWFPQPSLRNCLALGACWRDYRWQPGLRLVSLGICQRINSRQWSS